LAKVAFRGRSIGDLGNKNISMAEKLEIIIEHGDNEWWGRITSIENFLPVSVGNTVAELVENIRKLLQDWQQHEGKEDPVWSKVNFNEMEFDIVEQQEITND